MLRREPPPFWHKVQLHYLQEILQFKEHNRKERKEIPQINECVTAKMIGHCIQWRRESGERKIFRAHCKARNTSIPFTSIHMPGAQQTIFMGLSQEKGYGFQKRSYFLTVLFSNSIGKSKELAASTIIYLKSILACCYSSTSLYSPTNNPVNYELPHFDLWLFFICEFCVVPVLLLRQAQVADCPAWSGTIRLHSAMLRFTLLKRAICSTGFRCWPPGWKQLH